MKTRPHYHVYYMKPSESYSEMLTWYKTYGHKYPLEFRARFSQFLLLTRQYNHYEK